MKLQFDSSSEEDAKPSCLSLNFFSSLMAIQAKRKGIFQILSFAKKRDRVYSTRLNDGYFSVKVMIVNEAALQIQSGEIRQFYLLEGSLRNHGEGVIVMKEAAKCWKYGVEVGSPMPWRLKKENINFKGSNFVIWSTQKKEKERLSSSQIVLDYGVGDSDNESEKTASPVKNTSVKKPAGKSQEKENTKISQISDHQNKSKKKSQRLSQADCIESAPQPKSFPEPQKVITPLKQSNQQRFQSIMKLFFNDDGSSDEEPQPVIEPPKQSQIKPTTSTQKLMERKEDLQFIFNFLSDSEEEEKVEGKKEENCVLPSGILDSTSKKFEKSSSSDNDYDLTEWISKRTSKSSKEDMPDSKVNAKDKHQVQRMPVQPQTLFSDLSHGFVAKSWEVTAVLKCLIQHSSHTFCIISDQNHQYLINAIFSNTSQHPQLLQQGYLYRLGGGFIRQSSNQNLNLSNVDIQFNCNTSLIKQLQRDPEEAIESSSNYTPLQKIYDRQEGYMVNCFGILKDVRIIKGKNVSVHLEIVDPITKWTIMIVQFNAKGNNEELKNFIGRSLTIYGGLIGSYKTKKNIVRKLTTLVRHDFLPLTKEAREVRAWLEANNSLKSLETQLIGYTEISDLRATEEQPGVNFYLNKVVVFGFNSQLTYTACRICLKKVREGRCFTCGVRRPNQVQERLFLRGEIGDSTTSASVIWSNSAAENMLTDGFEEMKNKWLLKSVSVWIDKGQGGSLSIVRMKMRDCKEELQAKISEIRASLLKGA